jgi:hypothetical protein
LGFDRVGSRSACHVLTCENVWEVGAQNANLTLRGPELANAERWVTQVAGKEPHPNALQLLRDF